MAHTDPALTPALHRALHRAVELTHTHRHAFLTLEHLLLALHSDAQVQAAVAACGGNIAHLKTELERYLKERMEPLPEGVTEPTPTVAFHRVMGRALQHALSAEAEGIDGGAVLVALLQERESHAAYLLEKEGVRRLPLLRFLSHGAGKAPKAPEPTPDAEEEAEVVQDPLAAYAVDLVARAAAGGIDPLIGREAELDRMQHILCRRRKNNPLLVGESGVGKTALAEGLALRLLEGKVPEPLLGAPFYALDLGALLAGTRYRGDFEARVKAVLEALRAKPGALLFIDEIHTLVGAGSVSGGSLDASNLLKPALQNGELRCLGATTHQDMKASFDRDKAFSRRFQVLEVEEPSEADCLEILRGLKSRYESHHSVKFSEAALEGAVRLSARHLRDLHLPDKALDVLDEAGATQRLLPKGKRKKQVGLPEIEAVVARMARVPVQTVDSDDRHRLSNLEKELKAVVFGQDGAIEQLGGAIKLARSGLRGADRPTGSFLFTGPTGVGKTELAKQLARVMGVEFLRFDMSEYQEKHAVSRLIGAPPGYVGFDEGGLLVDAIRKHPHAVLLLDEIEKAHPDLFAILLQVMDHATLTDSHGRKADFRHVVLILTTNAGARDLSQRRVGFSEGGTGTSARGVIEKTFTPEFRNRLDAILNFASLQRPEILRVVDKQLAELQALLADKQVTIELSATARTWLAEKGYDPAFGARPMARLFEQHLKRPLADEILFGKLQKGGRVKVQQKNDGLAVIVS